MEPSNEPEVNMASCVGCQMTSVTSLPCPRYVPISFNIRKSQTFNV